MIKKVLKKEIMAQIGGFRVPPFKAALNVAWQTVRQTLPDKNRVGAENSTERLPPERVRFAAPNDQPMTTGGSFDQTEMSNFNPQQMQQQPVHSSNPFNPFLPQNNIAEDSFTQGYQQSDNAFPAPVRQGSVGSQFGSGSESSFGGAEGGKSNIKINEWQAAWNVTNAIQVFFIHILFLRYTSW